jgi:hypothetical protein
MEQLAKASVRRQAADNARAGEVVDMTILCNFGYRVEESLAAKAGALGPTDFAYVNRLV